MFYPRDYIALTLALQLLWGQREDAKKEITF
jgi:hypothetical protein